MKGIGIIHIVPFYMRILHTADWHLGKILYGKSLIEDQKYFINEVFVPIIEKEDPDLIIIAGDIFDKQVAPVEAIKLFDDFITLINTKFHIPLIMITGNHDSAGRIAIGSEILRENKIYISTSISDLFNPITFKNNEFDLNIYTLAYFNPSDARDYFNDNEIRGFNEAYSKIADAISYKINKNSINILVSHCFVTGCSVSDSENAIYIGGSGEISSSVFDNFDYVALGHLHSYQKTDKNGHYSGSPIAYSFNEASSEKFISVIEIDCDKITTRTIPIRPLHKMRILSGTFNELVQFGKNNPSDDYICVNLTDNMPVYMPVEQLRVYYPNIMSLTSEWLIFKGEMDSSACTNNSNMKKNLDNNHIFKEFLRQICNTKANENDLQVFMKAQEIISKEKNI